MDLFRTEFTDCVILARTGIKPDGQGGFENTWEETIPFQAMINFRVSVQQKVAEMQGLKGLWNVYFDDDVPLEYHTVFKRLSDGAIFRVDGKEAESAGGLGFGLKVISAEEWELA